MSFLNELLKSMARVLGRIIIYIILGFIAFYIFDNRVNASSYSWNKPSLIGISTSDNILDESGYLVNVRNTNSVKYNSTIWGGTHTYIRYKVADSDKGSNYVAKETYSFSYKASFTLVGNGQGIAKVTPKFYYYPDNNNSYGKATCDTQPLMTLTQTGTNPVTYEFTYSCNTFNVTRDVSWFAVGWSTSVQMNSVNMIQNFKLGGPSESQDIINNQNQNTQDIINNDNNNTDKITQNQDENTDKINDTLTDTTQPNLDNFTYTDSTSGLVSSFLTMPITLLRIFNKPPTCKPINLGSLYGSELTLPCIEPKNYLGDTIWGLVDLFLVFTMITNIAQLFIYVYEKFKNLDDFYNEFYTPRHADTGYKPRHGKED